LRLLGVGERRARLGVDHAQGAEVVALGVGQHRAGVEADVRIAGDQRIVDEARVQRGVLDNHDLVCGQADRVVAKGLVARGLAAVQAVLGLEPLPLAIDQRDRRHRGVERLGGQTGDVIEHGFGRGIQHPVRNEGREAVVFGHSNFQAWPCKPLRRLVSSIAQAAFQKLSRTRNELRRIGAA
jgi:hypothetical protein